MTNEPTPLTKVVAIRPPVNRDVIVMVHKLLALAESGDLQGLFSVTLHADESVGSGWIGCKTHVFKVLGGIEHAKLEFHDANIEKRV